MNFFFGREARQRDGPCIEDLIEIGPQCYNHLHIPLAGQTEDDFVEGPPVQVGLRSCSEYEVSSHPYSGPVEELVRWPLDFPLRSVCETNMRTLDGKIIELLRVDAGKFRREKLFCEVTKGRAC